MRAAFLACLAAVAVFGGCFGTGCAPNTRTLAPAGVYQSDVLLYRVDGLIEDVVEVYERVSDLAERHPEAIIDSESLLSFVTFVENELDGNPQPDELLASLFVARDTYDTVKNYETQAELESEMSRARSIIAQARDVIAAIASEIVSDNEEATE